MFTIILILSVLLISGLIFYASRNSYIVNDSFTGTAKFHILATSLLVIAVLVQPYSLKRIDAGHVGIKAALIGKERGVGNYEYVTGYVIVNSWVEQLYEFPTYQQHIDYPEQVVITKGGFQTTIKPSFNYSLVSGNIGDMFVNLRVPLKQVEQQWLMNAIISSVNDVANTWTVDDIFNNREKFEASIILEAKKRTGKWFSLSQLRTNISPPDALKKSILDKTKAIQDVQVAENLKKVAVAEAETNVAKAQGLANAKIAAARGDSASTIINAIAEAKAIQLKQQQVNGTYVEYIKWLNADPNLPRVPSTMLGSGTNLLYNHK
jgi:regulator of protease activity HflC (stomatin/prohibitin superfamily)